MNSTGELLRSALSNLVIMQITAVVVDTATGSLATGDGELSKARKSGVTTIAEFVADNLNF